MGLRQGLGYVHSMCPEHSMVATAARNTGSWSDGGSRRMNAEGVLKELLRLAGQKGW